MKFSNKNIAPPNENCVQAYKYEHWRCLIAEYALIYITSPAFLIQSLYDNIFIHKILGVNCIVDNASLSDCTPD